MSQLKRDISNVPKVRKFLIFPIYYTFFSGWTAFIKKLVGKPLVCYCADCRLQIPKKLRPKFDIAEPNESS